MTSIADKTRIIEEALDLRGAELRCQAAEHQALDAFLDYDAPTRAQVWRAMSPRGRNLIVSAMLIRAHNDWSEASVDRWVEHYNGRWGTEPTDADRATPAEPNLPLSDAAIAAALEHLATQAEMAARAADTPEDRALGRREMNAANKALSYHLSGLRAQSTESGWLVPSATTAATIYRVSATGCTCQAGLNGQPCWHAALVSAIGLADMMIDLADPYPTEDDDDASTLGRRLAAARAMLAHKEVA